MFLTLFDDAVGFVIVMVLLMKGVVVACEDEAVGVGTEAHRSAEAVQFGFLLVSHVRVLSLARTCWFGWLNCLLFISFALNHMSYFCGKSYDLLIFGNFKPFLMLE